MDLLEDYLKQEPLGGSLSYPDLEEAALRDAIKLSSECVVPIVEEIESDYHTRKKRVESSYEKAKEELNDNYRCQIDELEPNTREQAEKIQKEYAAQKQSLVARTKYEKEEAAGNARSELAHFKENYEYEIMIAGVVEEGSLKRCQKHMTEIRKSVSSAKSVLDELHRSTEQILAYYNVSINEKLCNGCKYCIEGCPLGVMQFDEEKEVAQKCDLCVGRLDRGLQPACVAACPSHCIYFGHIGEIIEKLGEKKILAWYKAISA